MAHISTKVTAAPSHGWRNTRSESTALRVRCKSGSTSSVSRQSSGTSSQRIHSMAARIKLLTTASAKPAPAKPAVRTCVPGANTFKKQPRHSRGQRGDLPEITAAHSAERRGQQQDQHVQQPGHLMPAADDKTAHTARCRIEKICGGSAAYRQSRAQTPARRSARPAKKYGR